MVDISSLIGGHKMKEVSSNKYKSMLWLLVAVALLLLTCIIYSSLDNPKKDNDSMAINEVITETIEEDRVDPDITGTELVESTNEVAVASAEIEVDPYSIIESEIEALRNKDAAMVNKYFGESTVFTPDAIADRLTATVVSFVSSNDTDNAEIIIHICTLDYDKMNEAAKEIKTNLESEADKNTEDKKVEDISNTTNIEVAKGVVSGDFDLHYNIPVKIENGSVVVTEELKQAITGNWYKGVNITLESVDCHIDKK